MTIQSHLPDSPLQEIFLPILEEKNVQLFIKRDDLIHPEISGNKWRKLKYNLQHVLQNNYKGVLSFGGAYSNHIAALAFACNYYKIPVVGIIRGENVENDTLLKAKQLGMELLFVDREEYRLRNDFKYLENLQNQFPYYFIIPEGGTNEFAIKGTEEIVPELDFTPDFIACAVGTGGTVAGIINSTETKVLAFPALKGDFVESDIKNWLKINKSNFEVLSEYHFGGYAKVNIELYRFVNDLLDRTGIQFDYIYNGKMMFGLIDLISKDYFKAGSKIVAIHSGGVQGNTGIEKRFK